MKQLLLTTLISIGLTLGANAKTYDHQDNMQDMSSKKIKRMDRKYSKHKAKKRHFKTQKEFLHRSKHKHSKNYDKHANYRQGYNYKRERYRADYNYNRNRQRGFSHWKRGWTLAYRYDRASFYDNKGYYYGYFNHHGYYFEDVFYRYDRYYTYQDRVRGKSLFNHRYYMPVNRRYYSFELTL